MCNFFLIIYYTDEVLFFLFDSPNYLINTTASSFFKRLQIRL